MMAAKMLTVDGGDVQDAKLCTCNLPTLCATTVRCGAGAWRGVLRLPPTDREVGECTEVAARRDENTDCGS